MTLATISETPSLRRSSQWALGFDALLMAASLAVCAALFAQGGFEASVFAMAGGIIAALRAAPAFATPIPAPSPTCSSAPCSPASFTPA